jgi:hypothetical protein
LANHCIPRHELLVVDTLPLLPENAMQEIRRMKATFKLPNGGMVETDLTFDQLKELIGINGHTLPTRILSARPEIVPLEESSEFLPEYDKFKKNLTQKAKQFLSILRQNPNGISADHIAERLGFNTPVQIGGMAGGGMGKLAKKFHVEMENVYTREIKFESGDRIVIYRPGKDIELVA